MDAQQMIEEHGDAVWRTVYRLLNDPDDARDCYQDTFVDALKLIERGTEVRHWPAVLRRIATCRAMDKLRGRYRNREHGTELIDGFVDRSRLSDDPSSRLETLELCDQVRGALADLPERQAEAFWLRHMEQLSPEAIAEQMDVTSANARQLVHRAVDALRRRLSGDALTSPATLTGDQR